MKPTEQQKLILEYDGNSVVIAAPGSGKTFVLSHKIKQNLKELLNHQGIIAISYTNKASNELKNRSLSNGENPKSSFFGTIDKFNLSEIVIPFGKHLFGIPSNDLKVTKINSLTDEEQKLFEWFDRSTTLEELDNDKVEIFKSYFIKGVILIETIGVLANYIFSNSIACQNYLKARYKYIYIDEYQDSGNEQHQLFLKLMDLNIKSIAVGDLNQSIYAFSGKDAKFLYELTQNSKFKYFKLDKNHRCHPSIINYSNYLLNQSTQLIPTEENQIFFQRVDGDEISIAKWIDDSIETIKKLFKIEANNQIAILTRGNRTAEILNSRLNISHRYFVSNELDINLNIWSAIFSNLLYFVFDVNFKFIDVIEIFTSYDKFNSNELKKLQIHKKKIEELRNEVPINKAELKKEFIYIAKIIAPALENKESIQLLDNILNSEREINSYQPACAGELNLMTLHKSKGLEFDAIIHLDLYEWILPHKIVENNDFDNPIYSNWSQDINLHYVGLTRARKGCVLLSSTQRTNSKFELKNAKDSEFIWIEGIEKLRYKQKNKGSIQK